jgi:hypothetical protein
MTSSQKCSLSDATFPLATVGEEKCFKTVFLWPSLVSGTSFPFHIVPSMPEGRGLQAGDVQGYE